METLLKFILFDIGAIVVGLLVTLYVFFRIRFRYWKVLNFPYMKPSFPLGTAGSSILGRESIAAENRRIYNKYEGLPYVGLFNFHQPVLFVRDLNLISQMLVKDFQHFHDRGIEINEENDPLAAHLFNLNGQKWKNIRNKLSPTFTSGKMKMMFSTMLECAEQLKEHMDGVADVDGEFEAREIAARFTTDVIAACAFGIKCNCLQNPDAEFRYWGRKVFKPSLSLQFRQTVNFFLPVVAKYLRIKSVDSDVCDFFMRIVKETIHERESKGVKCNDFMQLLIELRKENNNNDLVLTTELAAAQAFVFYLAGFETSSTVISFCLYLLSLHPDIQAKVVKEVDEMIRNNDGQISYHGILEARYLDQVVNETLRLYPAVPILLRECVQDYAIPGTDHVLKKGIGVVIPVEALQYDPNYFPNPEKFEPERFSPERKHEIPNYSFMPFGDGPRNCIGMRFGLMQVKLGLAILLSNFKFQKCAKTDIPPKLNPLSFVPFPENGIWLKVIKRIHKD